MAQTIIAANAMTVYLTEFYMRIILDDGSLRTTVKSQPIVIEMQKANIFEARRACAAVQEYSQRAMDRIPANYAIAKFADIVRDMSSQQGGHSGFITG